MDAVVKQRDELQTKLISFENENEQIRQENKSLIEEVLLLLLLLFLSTIVFE